MLTLDSGDKIRGDSTSAAEVDFVISGLDGSVRKALADGQLANAIGDLYTADSADTVLSIILVNTGAAHNHVNLYLTPSGGTARRLIPKDLQLEPGYSLHFDGKSMMVTSMAGGIVEGANVSDTAYAASWDGVTTVAPSKNAVYDALGGVTLAASGANTINAVKGTASLDVAAGAAVDADANLTVTAATILDEAVAMSAKAPKASPTFTGVNTEAARKNYGNTSVAQGATTTLFTISAVAASDGRYDIVAYVGGQGGSYTSVATLVFGANTGAAALLVNVSGGNLTLSLSGTSIQASHTVAGAATVYWAYSHIPLT
jgi:hypothetical protein